MTKRVLALSTAAFALAIATIVLVAPQSALLLTSAVLQEMFGRTEPPPIMKGHITAADWLKWDDAEQKITAMLNTRFPPGTDAALLESTLLAQGFEFPKPPPPDCVPRGERVPIGRVYRECFIAEQLKALRRTLIYEWGRFPCGYKASVLWSEGEGGEITLVKGFYYAACL